MMKGKVKGGRDNQRYRLGHNGRSMDHVEQAERDDECQQRSPDAGRVEAQTAVAPAPLMNTQVTKRDTVVQYKIDKDRYLCG